MTGWPHSRPEGEVPPGDQWAPSTTQESKSRGFGRSEPLPRATYAPGQLAGG